MSTQIRRQGDVAIVEPNGKLVGSSVVELREAIAPQIETYDEPRILINFENVNMIDSSGLGALMEARAITTRKKGRIGVINVGKNIKNLVLLSRLVSMFEHYDTEDAAVLGLSA
ncbi:STAS domain-containing protein [Candidatus Poribacteria bacterium]|nr:STAS domain-containing protein [Candidatus Poribacteria bacterium]